MAGTVVMSTLSDGTNSTSATNPIRGSAKAWGSYAYAGASTVPTLVASYNISSITQSSQGVYVFAFTNALPDSSYAAVVNATFASASQASVGFASSKSTSSFTTFVGYPSSLVGNATAFSWGIDFLVLD
jgi:hypothetical protein